MAPFVVIFAVLVAVLFPEQLSKLIFIPLVVYAAYGLKQNFDKLLRRSKQVDEEDTEKAYNGKR
ncbi:hypothetical protein D3C77_611000 [compost metagenome]